MCFVHNYYILFKVLILNDGGFLVIKHLCDCVLFSTNKPQLTDLVRIPWYKCNHDFQFQRTCSKPIIIGTVQLTLTIYNVGEAVEFSVKIMVYCKQSTLTLSVLHIIWCIVNSRH